MIREENAVARVDECQTRDSSSSSPYKSNEKTFSCVAHVDIMPVLSQISSLIASSYVFVDSYRATLARSISLKLERFVNNDEFIIFADCGTNGFALIVRLN